MRSFSDSQAYPKPTVSPPFLCLFSSCFSSFVFRMVPKTASAVTLFHALQYERLQTSTQLQYLKVSKKQSSISMRTIIILVLFVLTVRADFLLHYRFEERDASIVDSGGGGFNGRYIPAADKDNDTPETNDPERYHENSPGGRALGFFPELQSYALVPKTPFPKMMEELHLASGT